jgi:hypothetical protein
VYNLTLAKSKKTISAPRISEHMERIRPLVREWSEEESARKLVVTLDHQYTKDGLAWDALKGVDRVKAQVLLDAARGAGCRAYLGLLTFWESGSAEYAGGSSRYGRRRWDDEDEDEDDASNYEMGEINESSLTIEQMTDGAGKGLPIEELQVEEDDLLDPDSLTDVEPEEDFEGYTGNAGMTLDRWYRHAAIVLWPERRHFEVLCDRDSRLIVPVLKQMTTHWQKSQGKDAADLKTQCIDLAAAILSRWGENRYYSSMVSKDASTRDLVQSLAALDDPALIRRFLGDVLIKDVSIDPGKSLATLCQKHGWGTFRDELRAVMEGTTTQTIERNVGLLEEICSAKPGKKEGWAELCALLAQEFIEAVVSLDQKSSPADWRARGVKRADLLAGLARALSLTQQCDLLSRVVAHALSMPTTYPLTQAHLPALVSLQPWLKKNVEKPCPALKQWVASCREQLETLTAQLTAEPTDFRRPAEVKCKCADCAELNRFLNDPGESEHRFSVKQERRSHLEKRIREHKCDLDLETDRKRSPYTLVCTKNKASYKERLKTSHGDRENLATVRSIEASLAK